MPIPQIIGTTDFGFQERPDVAINRSVGTTPVDLVNLSAAGTKYMLRGCLIKSTDPGANTLTLSLVRDVNDVETVVDTSEIATAGYESYYDLSDLFGESELVGETIKIRAQMDTGNVTVTGQYNYAEAPVA